MSERSQDHHGLFGSTIRRRLPIVHYLVDVAVWAVALPLTTFSRYDFSLGEMSIAASVRGVIVVMIAQGAAGFASGLYTRRWRYGSFDEFRALAASVIVTGAILSIVHAGWCMSGAPRAVPALSTAVAISGTVAVRSAWRLHHQESTRRSLADASRTVVVGAGSGGEHIVRALLADPGSRYVPVAFVDDDPTRRHYTVSGVRVQGTLDDIGDVASRFDATHVLFAIPSAKRT